ncbi:hypothetical protein EI94DRAFT_1702149 [Lactarius quietus]|nr:hypothetical protein EI94DRAFT_1709503 [Lactarius quietus]KAF8265854.1 hypothetical protein EI94DRAFT_1702149 [Lactarius quietus]
MSLNASQMIPELIPGIDQAHSMGAGISGVIYGGTRFTLEPARGEGRPNPRWSRAYAGGGPVGMPRSGPHDLGTSPRCSMKRDQVIPRKGFSPSSLSETQVPHADSPKYPCFSVIPSSDHPAFYNHGDRELRSALPRPPFRQILTSSVRMCHICGQRLPQSLSYATQSPTGRRMYGTTTTNKNATDGCEYGRPPTGANRKYWTGRENHV